MRGFGRVYRRGRIWWIAYSERGVERRESSGSTVKEDAKNLLKDRIGERHRLTGRSAPRLSAVMDDYIADLELRQSRPTTIRYIRKCYRGALLRLLGDISVDEITTRQIRGYQRDRSAEGYAPASVNRELSALRTAMRLAVESGLVRNCPTFPTRLREATPRQGFFEHGDYLAVRGELKPWAQDVLDFAYFTGWRRMEIFRLGWDEIFGDMIRLSPDRSKNREGRPRPIWDDIAPVMERRKLERRMDCPFVFHRDGVKIATATWQRHWTKARKAAGMPNKILHDTRRTAVRNLDRAGVSRKVAMALVGHKTQAIYDRYNIVSEDDLRDGAEKLQRYVAGQDAARKVIPLFGRAAWGKE